MKHHRQISLSISLLLILNVHGVVGQEPVKALFKFAPLSLIDPYGPNIQLGFEFIRQGKISFETDFAVYTQESKKGMKFRPEIRYYPSRRKTHLPGNGFWPSLTMGIKLGFRIPLDKQSTPNGNTI